MGKVVLEHGVREDSVDWGFSLIADDDGLYWATYKDLEGGIKFQISKKQYDQLDACNSKIRITVKEKLDKRKTLNIEQINQVIIEDVCKTKKASIYYDMTIEW